MRDLHTCRLQREDARLGTARIGRKIHQDVEIGQRDALRCLQLRQFSDNVEVIAQIAIPLCDCVRLVRQRKEKQLEAAAIVMAHGLPHHLAHDMVTQVTGEITDADTPGSSLRRQCDGCSVDAP